MNIHLKCGWIHIYKNTWALELQTFAFTIVVKNYHLQQVKTIFARLNSHVEKSINLIYYRHFMYNRVLAGKISIRNTHREHNGRT